MRFDESGREKLAVISLGGNAIIRKGQKGDIHEQFSNTRKSMESIVDMMELGYNFIITHGNGPQVGNLMLMVDRTSDEIPETPLGIADAMTCGSIGYMIEQCLQNVMIRRGIWRHVVTLPSQVLVDPSDPALNDPTKPIGPFYTKEEADMLRSDKGWVMKEDAGRGYRRYVASPYPLDIIEKDAIRTLLEKDYIVITGGGGGIPVRYEKDRTIEGVDCVIDKDLASMKVALAVGAHTLVIITGVPRVSLNFGTPTEEQLTTMTLTQARYYHTNGQFPAGSMGPKIDAAIQFVQADPKNKVVITDESNLAAAMKGEEGTTIIAY